MFDILGDGGDGRRWSPCDTPPVWMSFRQEEQAHYSH